MWRHLSSGVKYCKGPYCLHHQHDSTFNVLWNIGQYVRVCLHPRRQPSSTKHSVTIATSKSFCLCKPFSDGSEIWPVSIKVALKYVSIYFVWTFIFLLFTPSTLHFLFHPLISFVILHSSCKRTGDRWSMRRTFLLYNFVAYLTVFVLALLLVWWWDYQKASSVSTLTTDISSTASNLIPLCYTQPAQRMKLRVE